MIAMGSEMTRAGLAGEDVLPGLKAAGKPGRSVLIGLPGGRGFRALLSRPPRSR